jgi:hypothetical protein
MRKRQQGPDLRVQSQGRAYAAVIGVTVGMLVAGLGVPLAFGHTPRSDSVASGPGALPTLAPTFAAASGEPGATLAPGTLQSLGPGGSVGPDGPLPSASTVTTGPSPTAGPVRLTATDQGVTAKSVKVGVVLIDIQALAPLGFQQPHFSPQEQQQQYQTFIDQVNKQGGLAGRSIAPVYVTYNPLDTASNTSAGYVCTHLAQDLHVFAAMGVLDGNIAECLTEQYGIPAIANVGHLAEAYTKGHNLLVSPYASLERGAANWGDLVARSGLLRGRTLGTVTINVPQEARPEQTLVNTLGAANVKVAYRAKFSSDENTARAQLSIEMQHMHDAGVNTVFLVTNFAAAIQWVQQAERQEPGWNPQYMVSDLGSLTAEGLISTMPASFNGAYAYTQSTHGRPENAEDTRCRTSFNAATGNHYAAGNESGGVTLFCWMVRVLDVAADQVGPELTRSRLAAAFQNFPNVALPHVLGGSFRSNKTDFADYFRLERYATSCKCYSTVTPAQRGRY